MKIKFLTLALGCLYLVGCSNNNDDDGGIPEDASLIFGLYAGECSGDCSDMYFLNNESIAVDGDNRFPTNDFFIGNFLRLPQSNYDLAKELLEVFLTRLLSETGTVFGCPDCVDQGGYYLEYQDSNQQYAWRIDTNLDEVPTYLHDYIELLAEKITLLPRE